MNYFVICSQHCLGIIKILKNMKPNLWSIFKKIQNFIVHILFKISNLNPGKLTINRVCLLTIITKYK